MNALGQIYRSRIEACQGRIEICSGNWIFDENVTPSDTTYHHGTDATGRATTLVKQRGVWCLNPEVAEGKYPENKDRKMWFVPWKVCRKCEHYRKTGKLRFPHCALTRQKRGGRSGAARDMLGLYNKAAKEAKELLR